MATETQRDRRTESAGNLIERARMAASELASHAERTERDLRPAAKSVAVVRASGLFALSVPREAGGLDADLAELGQGCSSTAWITALNSAVTGLAAFLPDEGRGIVFADPDAMLCGSANPTDAAGTLLPEGLRITGRWRTASGCEDADWAVLLVPVLQDGQPMPPRGVAVPMADLIVDRTWRVAGLRGTGSHTLVADDVLVPTNLVTPGLDALLEGGGLQLVDLKEAVLLLSALAGSTQGAQAVIAGMLAGDRAPSGTTYQRVAESSLARFWFTNATGLIDTAMRRILSVADTLDERDQAAPFPIEERARMRMELVTAAQECRQAMEKFLDLHGASGFNQDNALQRFWRDVAVGTRHRQFNPYITGEDYGRLLLNAGPPSAMML
jgi:alkylation response protein AidB-like acyl-CoA dehydrogenase